MRLLGAGYAELAEPVMDAITTAARIEGIIRRVQHRQRGPGVPRAAVSAGGAAGARGLGAGRHALDVFGDDGAHQVGAFFIADRT